MPDRLRLFWRSVLWLVLGGWIGASGYFALVVARAVFRVLPSHELAGRVVDAVYTPLQLYGVGAGLVLAALALVLGRSRWLVALPAVLSLLCFTSHFGITPRLDELRAGAFGAAPQAAASAEFWRLHGASMAIHAAVLLGAIGLLVLHVWADLRDAEKREIP
jgi:MFS superfamily sulfate permease-like transporter